MANLTTFGANSLWDGTAMPATLYCKLHVGAPGAAATANAAGNTLRKAFTRVASSAGATSNVAALTWTAVGTAEDYTHFSAWDNVSAGNAWLGGTITANPVAIGDDFDIAIGDLDLTFDIIT